MIEIKKTLNNTPRLVFWRIDDALGFLIPFSLGMLNGSILLIGSGFFSIWLIRRIRKRYGDINFRAFAYWTFGSGFSGIPSYIRRIRQ